jgi:hypothetical protein
MGVDGRLVTQKMQVVLLVLEVMQKARVCVLRDILVNA